MNPILNKLMLLWLLPLGLNAQSAVNPELSFDNFMRIVVEHHPMAKSANLELQNGLLAIKEARGGFDPQALGDVGQKYFKDASYYSHINGGLKIPTWLGISVDAGYEVNSGEFLNPEATTPTNGLWYAGASIPLGQGLMIDKRRAELRKAEIFNKSTEADRALLLNELLYDAGVAYWSWFNAYRNFTIYEDALEVATERLEAVKQYAAIGERPIIDTLEARIQVQNRLYAMQNAQMEFFNATAQLSVYTWAEGVLPLELDSNTVPVDPVIARSDLGEDLLMIDRDTLAVNHPKLRLMSYKIQEKEIEQRMNKEQLKPVANLKYRALSDGDKYSINDYTWGFEFKIPLFLRAERARVKQTSIELDQMEYEMQSTAVAINNGVRTAANTLNTTYDQIELYQDVVTNYGQLLESERQLFDAGESSLFLVNSRELGYIDAQLKLISLTAKNRMARLRTQYVLGNLNQIQ